MTVPASTLVCFAVKEEAKFFTALAASRPHVRVLLTGMGRQNAERTIRAALSPEPPRLVLSAGFAGGLRPGLTTGAVVFQTDDEALGKLLAEAGAQPGRFHCGERVATTTAEKRALWQTTRADAVEMESQVIGGVCKQNSLSSATVRVILDVAEQDLPLDFNRIMTTDLRVDSAKLAVALAKSPGRIPALLRLRKQSEEAARKLAEVLDRVTRV